MKSGKPNILLIQSDQQRWDSLGCYGVDWIQTPHLDSLAEGGMVFDACYVNNPVCTPSRASMFTGKHLPGHGVYRLHDVLPDNEILFPEHLRNAGYATALFGKLHVSGRMQEEQERHPHDGFDTYEWCMEASISMDSPYNGYSQWLHKKSPEFWNTLKTQGRKLKHIPREYHFTHWAAERTIDFIENRDTNKPFFCMMSVFDPHNPYDDYPSEYAVRVDQDKMPSTQISISETNHTIGALAREQKDGYLGPYTSFTEEDFLQMRIGYYASVALLDDEVGKVLAALERQGIAEETLVIFVSDHGDMLGDHGLLVKGAFFYESCVRVPLIIRQPGVVPSNTRSQALVQPHDLAATILSTAGLPEDQINALMPDSRDIRKAQKHCHETAVCLYRQTGIDAKGRYFEPPLLGTMITDGRYKMNIYPQDTKINHGVQGQLFDLNEDPLEQTDLWDTDKEVRLSLMDSLYDWTMQQEIQSPRRAASAEPPKEHLITNRLK